MFGLIGAGYWGKNLIREFYNLGVLKIICDIDQNLLDININTYPNLKTTTSFYDLLHDDELTGIIIALPAEMHYRFAKKVLLANKNVYVEKPLALSIDHCNDLIHIANEHNKILMVGHLLQYHPCITKIYDMINNDYIGDIRYIVSNRLNLGKIRREENVLWSFAPHDISVILKLMKNKLPNSIQCTGKSFISNNIHDITSTILNYDNTYVQINVNWLNPFKEQKLTIVGTKGMIIFDDTIKDKLKYYPEYMQWNKGQPIINKSDGEIINYDSSKSPLQRECEEFIKCCANNTPSLTDGEEGRRVLTVLNMAQQSLLNNGQEIVQEISRKMEYYVHETAIVDDDAIIGKGSKIWHYSHIMKSEIGEDCNIGQNVFIGKDVKIGKNCKIQNNVSLYSGLEAEDNVFFGPSCVFTNDKNPRCEYSKQGNYMKTYIEEGATIGANSTIVCGTRLGKYCLIGAGAVVTKDVEPYAVMVGNPAKKIKYTDEKCNL